MTGMHASQHTQHLLTLSYSATARLLMTCAAISLVVVAISTSSSSSSDVIASYFC